MPKAKNFNAFTYGVGLEFNASSFKSVKDSLKSEFDSLGKMVKAYNKMLEINPDTDLSEVIKEFKDMQTIISQIKGSSNPFSEFVDKGLLSRISALENGMKQMMSMSEKFGEQLASVMKSVSSDIKGVGEFKFPGTFGQLFDDVEKKTKEIDTLKNKIAQLKQELDNLEALDSGIFDVLSADNDNTGKNKKTLDEINQMLNDFNQLYKKIQSFDSSKGNILDIKPLVRQAAELGTQLQNAFSDYDFYDVFDEKFGEDIILSFQDNFKKVQICIQQEYQALEDLIQQEEKKLASLRAKQSTSQGETSVAQTIANIGKSNTETSGLTYTVKVIPKANASEWTSVINRTIASVQDKLDPIYLKPTFSKNSKSMEKDVAGNLAQLSNTVKVNFNIVDNLDQSWDDVINNIKAKIDNANQQLAQKAKIKVAFAKDENFQEDFKNSVYKVVNSIKDIKASIYITNGKKFLKDIEGIRTSAENKLKDIGANLAPIGLNFEVKNRDEILSNMDSLRTEIEGKVQNIGATIADLPKMMLQAMMYGAAGSAMGSAAAQNVVPNTSGNISASSQSANQQAASVGKMSENAKEAARNIKKLQAQIDLLNNKGFKANKFVELGDFDSKIKPIKNSQKALKEMLEEYKLLEYRLSGSDTDIAARYTTEFGRKAFDEYKKDCQRKIELEQQLGNVVQNQIRYLEKKKQLNQEIINQSQVKNNGKNSIEEQATSLDGMSKRAQQAAEDIQRINKQLASLKENGIDSSYFSKLGNFDENFKHIKGSNQEVRALLKEYSELQSKLSGTTSEVYSRYSAKYGKSNANIAINEDIARQKELESQLSQILQNQIGYLKRKADLSQDILNKAQKTVSVEENAQNNQNVENEKSSKGSMQSTPTAQGTASFVAKIDNASLSDLAKDSTLRDISGKLDTIIGQLKTGIKVDGKYEASSSSDSDATGKKESSTAQEKQKAEAASASSKKESAQVAKQQLEVEQEITKEITARTALEQKENNKKQEQNNYDYSSYSDDFYEQFQKWAQERAKLEGYTIAKVKGVLNKNNELVGASVGFTKNGSQEGVVETFKLIEDKESGLKEFIRTSTQVTSNVQQYQKALDAAYVKQTALATSYTKQINGLQSALDPNANNTLFGTEYEGEVNQKIKDILDLVQALHQIDENGNIKIFDSQELSDQKAVIELLLADLKAYIKESQNTIGANNRNQKTDETAYSAKLKELEKTVQKIELLKAQAEGKINIGENTQAEAQKKLAAEKENYEIIKNELAAFTQVYDAEKVAKKEAEARAEAEQKVADIIAKQKDAVLAAKENRINSTVNKAQSNYDLMLHQSDSAPMSDFSLSKLKEYKTLLDELKRQQESFNNDSSLFDNEKAINNFNKLSLKLKDVKKEYDALLSASIKFMNKIENASDLKPLDSSFNAKDVSQLKDAMQEFANSASNGEATLISFNAAEKTATYQIKDAKGQLQELHIEYDKGTNSLGRYIGKVEEAQSGFQKFVGGIKGKFKGALQYAMSFLTFYKMLDTIKKGITYVKEIDTALTELKKVTDETDETYSRFLKTMSQTGAEIGATVADLTNMAAAWARLGYSIKEAGDLAKSTAVLLNVSEFTDADKASEALISTMQAYGYAAEDSMHVVDILNEVGNNFAISSDGIATALQDSASSLMAAGNNLEQSVAMIAAANKVLQDPNSVGSALRTISLRIRGTSTKVLEEMGEETDGVIESVSKLQAKVKGLSGVDILTDSGSYKDTYTIIKEIAEVWDQMNDIDRAALLELLAGKNRSNAMAALLTNLEDLEGAYESAMEAQGSAEAENEKYLNSIQGKIDQFNNAVQTLWMNLINSDAIKFVVDTGTKIIQFLDTLPGKITAITVAITALLKGTKGFDMITQGLNATLGTNFKKSKIGTIFDGITNAVDDIKTTAKEATKAEKQKAEAVNNAVEAEENEVRATQEKVESSVESAEANKTEAVSSTAASNADLSEKAASDAASTADITEASASDAAAQADMAEAAASSAASTADIAESATSGVASATGIVAASFGKLKGAVSAHPFIAIAVAVLAAVAAIDAFTETAQEAAEASHDAFNEIANAFDSTKSNISGLESELSTINSQISGLEGKNLSFTDDQELQRLKKQRTALEDNLSIQKQLLKSQEEIKNERAVVAMKDFIKASNEGAESATKTGKTIGAVIGGTLVAAGILGTVFSGGTASGATIPITLKGAGLMLAAVGGGAAIGGAAGGVVGSNLNAAKVSTYEDWYKTYTEAYKEKSQAATDARKKYEKDPGNMDKYDKWQELEQDALDVQSKMYDNLTQMQNYYSGIQYGQSEAMDKELDAWNNFLDKMNIEQNGAGAKVNALDRIFGENASDEVKAFRKEIDKVLENGDTTFDIAAEIEGRDDLQKLEDQLNEVGITTKEVSDYFRKTGEIGTEAFSDLSGEIAAAETAMTNLQSVLEENTNEGYETRNTGLEEMKDLMEKGAIGSESKLWNIAEAMGFTYDSAKSIEANADALYEYIKVRDDWYQVDDNGDWGVSGANVFAEDIEQAIKNSKELQEMDIKWNFDETTGTLDFDFNNMQFDKIIDALSRTKEAAGLTNEEFIDMLTHLGQFYDIQWTNGNDVVSYLEYLGSTSLSVKDQLAAVQEPLEQLLRKQNLDSKEIESYLTGDGALNQLPEDLQAAVNAYRALRDEVEKPIETQNIVEAAEPKESEGFFSKVAKFFKGGTSKEEVEQHVDVDVKADKVDTTDVQNKTEDAVQNTKKNKDSVAELEVKMEDLVESMQQIEDKDVTIDVKVKGLDDVKELNKNIDLATKIDGSVDKLSEYVEGAKALSELDNNITSHVTANVDGNVTDFFMTEGQIDNLEVFAEGAKALKGVGSFRSDVTANVHGNITGDEDTKGKFEYQINNLETFADGAKALQDVKSKEVTITANVDGNVIDTFEYKIDNLKTFTDSAADVKDIGNVTSKVTADVSGNVIDTPEYKINNLKVFVDSAKDVEKINNVESSVTADVHGNVVDGKLESQIDNLKVFSDSAKDVKDIGNVESSVTAEVNGNVTDFLMTEGQINNLKVFSDSAKEIGNVGDVSSSVTANVDGNVIDTFEYKINNLKTFTDSAKDVDKIGDVESSVTADVHGNVVDSIVDGGTPEYRINNLKVFSDSAKDVGEIGDVKSSVTANVYGNVTGDKDTSGKFEFQIDNLKVFSDSAKDVGSIGDVESSVTANVHGNVVDSIVDGGKFEFQTNNLKTFAEGAKALQDVDSKDVAVTADVDGNVVDVLMTEGRIDNLEVFAKGAQALDGLKDNITVNVTADTGGNITDESVSRLEYFSSVIDGLPEDGTVAITVTANVATEDINSAISLLTEAANSGIFKDYNATVKVGAEIISIDDTVVDNYTAPQKDGEVVYTVDSTAVDEWVAPDKTGEIKYTPVIDALTDEQKHKTGTITYKANISGLGFADGTAHANGTAFAGGNFGAKKTETALTGELGPEILVRDGRWTTVGENGAEFTEIKRGDIIFNHKQTEELLKNGHVISGSGRGKSYASGTAYAGSSSRFTKYRFDDSPASTGSGSEGISNTVKETSDTVGDAADSVKDAADDAKQTIDFIEYRLEEIENAITNMANRVENFLDDTSQTQEKNNLYEGLVSAEKQKASTYLAAAEAYNKKAAQLLSEVPAEYQEMAKNGAIAIKDFIGENEGEIADAIEEYRTWSSKAEDAENNYLASIAEISAKRLEQLQDIADDFENIVGLTEQHSNLIQAEMDLLDEAGERLSENFYNELMKDSKKQIEDLNNKRASLQDILDNAVKSGDVQVGSDDWYEMVNAIFDVDDAILECKKDIEGFQNSINDLYWDNLDKLIDRIDNVDSELSHLYNLVSDEEKVVDDAGNWTKDGVTALGLLAQQLEVANFKVEQYGEAIAHLEKDYAAGLYSTDEYNEKLAELKENQWDAIEAQESAKKSIIDLNKTRIQAVKDGMQKEIDAYSELIDKKKEELNLQKESHDFSKQVAEQQKNIADIEKRLAAISGDNSASAIAQKKKLQAELAQAKEELEELYYDHSVEKQQEALDKSLEDYQNNKQDEMDALDESLKNENQIIQDSYATIAANTESLAQNLSDIADKYGISLSDSVTKPWLDGADAIGTYQEQLDTSTSSFTDQLKLIKQELTNLQVEADKTANSIINATNGKKDKTEGARYTPPTPSQQPSSSSKPATPAPPSKGASVTLKKSATHFSRDGGNGTRMQSWVPGSTFTVYQVSGSEVLIGRNGGYTGWVKLSDIEGYASGAKSINKDQFAFLDELGEELQLVPDGAGRLSYVKKGTGIIPADLTERLMEWGQLDPSSVLEQSRPTVSAPHVINNNIELNMQVGEVVHIDHADNGSIPNITKAVQDQMDNYMKNINKKLYNRVR